MQVLHIDHIQLAMPAGREDEARAFYRDVLGIAEIAKPTNLAARGGCRFESGSLKVHLGVEEGFAPARKAHLLSSSRVCANWPLPCNAPDTTCGRISLLKVTTGCMSMIPSGTGLS